MIDQPMHILDKMGVLVSFSIAKKISEDYINSCLNNKKNNLSEKQLLKLIQQKTIEELKVFANNNQIPGLLSPQEIAKEVGINDAIIKNIPKLNRLLLACSNILLENKVNKISLCYFINALVNILNLNETDFEKFHKEFNKFSEDENSDESEN